MTEILVVGLVYVLILLVQNWDEVRWSTGLLAPHPPNHWMHAFTKPGVLGTLLSHLNEQNGAKDDLFHGEQSAAALNRPFFARRARSRMRRTRDSYGPLDPRRHPPPH